MSSPSLSNLAPSSVRMSSYEVKAAEHSSHAGMKHHSPCGMKHASPRMSPCDMKPHCSPRLAPQGHHRGDGQHFGKLVLWFLLISLLAWFLLWTLKPVTVLKKDYHGRATDEVDSGKVLAGALATGLIVTIFLIIYCVGVC